MSEEDYAYLEDDFDPAKLRVADLRRVLGTHSVEYPQTAKKADYVALFNEHITPRRAELRKQYVAVEPDGARIVDAPPSPTKRARSPARRVTRSAAAAKEATPEPEAGALGAAAASPRRTTRARSPARAKSPSRGRAKAGTAALPPASPGIGHADSETAGTASPSRRKLGKAAADDKAPSALTTNQDEVTVSLTSRSRVRSVSPSRQEQKDAKPTVQATPPKVARNIPSSLLTRRISEADVSSGAATPAHDSPFSQNNLFQSSANLSKALGTGASTAAKRKREETQDGEDASGNERPNKVPALLAESDDPEPIKAPRKRANGASRGSARSVSGSLSKNTEPKLLPQVDPDLTGTADNLRPLAAEQVSTPSMDVDPAGLNFIDQFTNFGGSVEVKQDVQGVFTDTQQAAGKTDLPLRLESDHELDADIEPDSEGPEGDVDMPAAGAGRLRGFMPGLSTLFPQRSSEIAPPLPVVTSSGGASDVDDLAQPITPQLLTAEEADVSSASAAEEDSSVIIHRPADVEAPKAAKKPRSKGKAIEALAEATLAKVKGKVESRSRVASEARTEVAPKSSGKEKARGVKATKIEPSSLEDLNDKFKSQRAVSAGKKSKAPTRQQKAKPETAAQPVAQAADEAETEVDGKPIVSAILDAPVPAFTVEPKPEGVQDVPGRPSAASVALNGILLLLQLSAIVLTVIFAAWWREQKLAQGFCDVELEPPARSYPWPLELPIENALLAEYQVHAREALDQVWPSCTPCPEHAMCGSGGYIQCEDNYLLTSPAWSLGGLLPLSPQCRPDLERQRKLGKLAERAAYILHERRAQVECHETDRKAEMSEDELRGELYKLKLPQVDEQEFDELWRQVLVLLSQNADIELQRQVPSPARNGRGSANKELTQGSSAGDDDDQDDALFGIGGEDEYAPAILVSHSLAHMSLMCYFRYSIVTWLNQHRPLFIRIGLSLGAAVALALYVLAYQQQRRRRSRLIEELFEALRAQQQAADTDPLGRTVRYVTVGTLRPRVPKRQWPAVQRAVEDAAAVRVRQVEIFGEITRVWEWTGR